MMYKRNLILSLIVSIPVVLAACSSNDDSDASDTSEFNPNAPGVENTGEPGGDISAIAGLWDGTTAVGDANDVVYWNLATNGVLTRYDYQQDGIAGATGENCYLVDDPITVTPEGGDDYSIFDVAVSATRSGDQLTVVFNEADKNDLNANGNTEETPTFVWTSLTTPVLEDLNSCSSTEESSNADDVTQTPLMSDSESDNTNEDLQQNESDPSNEIEDPSNSAPPIEPSADRPVMSRAECATNGGTVIGDIGDGAIHRPEYRCESGAVPIGRVIALEGEPIASEGEVCCI